MMSLLFVVIIAAAAVRLASTADCAYSATHSNCLEDSVNIATTEEFTADEKVKVASLHNDKRRGVIVSSATETDLTAANLLPLEWSDELAETAGHWAKQCKWAHDDSSNRNLDGFVNSIGQNMYAAYSCTKGITSMVDNWYSEISGFQYGTGAVGNATVGHFTQVVREDTQRVGCGVACCASIEGLSSKFHEIMVCNYDNTNNKAKPFVADTTRGSQCKTVTDGLCDCPTKCSNKGQLSATCTCDCPYGWTGDLCDTEVVTTTTTTAAPTEFVCPTSDPSYCGVDQPYGYPKSYCDLYTNVQDDCPHMCGKCGGGTTTPKPACTASDPSYCGKDQPYGYPESFCDQYTNVPDACPAMCNKCVSA